MPFSTQPLGTPSLSPRARLLHGPAMMMTANLFFGFVPVLARYAMLEGYPSSEVMFIRFALACVVVVALLALGLGRLDMRQWRLLFLRGLFGGIAVLCYFYAIQMTSAAKGVLLNYTHSMWANVYTVFFFSHRPPRGFWWILAMAGAGLWLVLDPSFSSFNSGDALGLVSGMAGGVAIMTIKQLRRETNVLTVFASFAVFGSAMALIPGAFEGFGATAAAGPGTIPASAYGSWMMPHGTALWVLLGLAALGMTGQMFFTHGYGFTSIALGTVMSLSVPAIAAVAGWVFLGEPLTPNFLLGGTLIMGACGLLQFREAAESKI